MIGWEPAASGRHKHSILAPALFRHRLFRRVRGLLVGRLVVAAPYFVPDALHTLFDCAARSLRDVFGVLRSRLGSWHCLRSCCCLCSCCCLSCWHCLCSWHCLSWHSSRPRIRAWALGLGPVKQWPPGAGFPASPTVRTAPGVPRDSADYGGNSHRSLNPR